VAKQLAHEIARFPQACVRSDRMSVYRQHGLPVRKALETERQTSIGIMTAEGIGGAGRFKAGKGRHGDYADIRLQRK
jgi:enoyl-CoA hydratase